jgi:ADP-ribose pyrophosphatase YjhB (NUDIX family)
MTMPARPHYCVLCGTRLAVRDDRGHPRPTCPACGWIYYRNPAPAAGVLLHTPRGILLVRRRWPPAEGAWCLPAGFMEYGESPERCAVRETREETGLMVRLRSLFGVYAGMDDPRVRAVLILYTAERIGGRLRAGDDAVAVRWFPLTRLPGNIAFAAHRKALSELAAERQGD